MGPVREDKIRTAPYRAHAGPVSGRTINVQNSPGTAGTGPGSVMRLRHQLIQTWWCIYTSENLVTIASGNGLTSVWFQVTAWTNADLSSIRHLGMNFNEISVKHKYFSTRKSIWKLKEKNCPQNDSHFLQVLMCKWGTLFWTPSELIYFHVILLTWLNKQMEKNVHHV